MPINKSDLKGQLKEAFEAAQNSTDPNTALDNLCTAMALAIATQIQAGVQTATFVNVPALVSPSGAVTGTIATTATNTIV